MEFNLINVGIADLQVGGEGDVLRTILGSCVGICLYDPVAKIGGLSHIMLPTYKTGSSSKKKYADTAIPMMLNEMLARGAEHKRIIAKIIGGSQMFNLSSNSIMSEIGRSNVDKSREILISMKFDIVSEDTGGNYGRTIDFYLNDGSIKVKSIGKEDIYI